MTRSLPFLAALFAFVASFVSAEAHAYAAPDRFTGVELTCPVDHFAGWTDHADGQAAGIVAVSGSMKGAGIAVAGALALAIGAAVLTGDVSADTLAAATSLFDGGIYTFAATTPLIALRKQRATKVDEARAILEKATKEERKLTDEERTAFDAAEAEAKSLAEDIARHERQAELDADLETRTEVRTVPSGPVGEDEGGDPKAPAVGEERAAQWPRRVVRYFNAIAMGKEDRSKSARMLASVEKEAREMSTAQVRDEDKQAEQIIERSGLPHHNQKRLRALLEVGEFRTLMTTDDDANGGFNLLPKPFLAEIFVLREEYGAARKLFRVIPFTGAGNKIDLKNAISRVIAYWVDQGELIPPSDPGFANDFLNLNKLAGITSWTNEAQEDSAFALMPFLQEDFAEAITLKEDLAGIVGTGTAEFGGFTGVFNLPGAQIIRTDGTDGTPTEAKLRAVKQSVTLPRRGNASWLMHESVMEEIRQIENGSGRRLFTESLSEEGAVMLLGHRVEFAEVAPAASGIGADEPVLSFGDHSRVLMGEKGGLSVDLSTDAILQNSETGAVLFNAFQSDGALLRVKERVGFATPTSVRGAIGVLKSKEAA